MKLEFLPDANVGGAGDDLVRLFDFTPKEVQALANEIGSHVLTSRRPLRIDGLAFIQPLNCELTFAPSDSDQGITTMERGRFICKLTEGNWFHMLSLIRPFAESNTDGYQWLYDLADCHTELLLSTNGQW